MNRLRTDGVCFGFHVTSDVGLRYLRPGAQGDQLEVSTSPRMGEPVGPAALEWPLRGSGGDRARLYVRDHGYSLRTDREGWFHIDPTSARIEVPVDTDPVRRETRLWGVPVVLCFLHRGDVSLHASAVEVDGSALLFAAPGRFGKTTMAAAFLAAGYPLVAEDISCCRPSPTPIVFPGPAVLRVRRDAFRELDIAGTDEVAVDPDRVHLAIDEPRRGDGSPLPIRGIVFLRPGAEGGSLERVDPVAAIPDLWALSWKLPVERDLARCFRGTAALAASVPIWNLPRSDRFDALAGVVEQILETCVAAA
jgi:hypothetical protein